MPCNCSENAPKKFIFCTHIEELFKKHLICFILPQSDCNKLYPLFTMSVSNYPRPPWKNETIFKVNPVIKLNVESLSFQGCRDPAVIYRNGHK
jgi:hypothetical protein